MILLRLLGLVPEDVEAKVRAEYENTVRGLRSEVARLENEVAKKDKRLELLDLECDLMGELLERLRLVQQADTGALLDFARRHGIDPWAKRETDEPDKQG